MKVVSDVPYGLFGVAHAHLDILCQTIDGLLHEKSEERQLMKDTLVGLFEEVFLEIFGEISHKGMFFFQIIIFLQVDGLLNVVVDFPV